MYGNNAGLATDPNTSTTTMAGDNNYSTGNVSARHQETMTQLNRTVTQAEVIERPEGPVAPPDVVVHLAIPTSVVHERLARRAAEDDRPDDRDPAVADRRVRVYEDETAPLIDRYRDRGRLVTVDADRPVEEVTAAIIAAVDAHRAP